jgi:aminoglycoside 6'-N-acetyltransferase
VGDTVADFGDLTLRNLSRGDIPLLVEWRAHPDVHEWYGGGPRTTDHFERRYFAENDPIERCIVILEGRPIGYLQFYEYTDDWRPAIGLGADEEAWGIDLFIGETELHGRGIGSRLVAAVAAWLAVQRGASRVVVDPHVKNERAIRAYRRAGFRKVRLLPSYERVRGVWRDAWLMEWRPG